MRFRSRDRREMNYYSDVLVNKDLVKEIRLYDYVDIRMLLEDFYAKLALCYRNY